jgi:hypothetical protein
MRFKQVNTTQGNNLVGAVQRKLLLIAGLLVLVSLFIQFGILSTVGTIGPQISNVRSEREQMQLDNEIKSALIRDYQTSDRVMLSLSQTYELQQAQLARLEYTDPNQQTQANAR